MINQPVFQIDIDTLLAEKAPQKAKYIPQIARNYLKRIVHQRELNDFLKANEAKMGVDFFEAAIKELFSVQIKLIGTENVPKEGLFTFVSNHPLGGLDGIILGYSIGKMHHHQVKVIINDLLMHIRNLQSVFIPVNKHGAQAKTSALLINQAFQSNNQIITFPAGLCSRKINGVIQDLEWKKMFITKSIQSKRDVIPIYFEGTNSSFFYNLSTIRRKLGIKANLEMLYLSDEMFKCKGKSFTVTFGKPIPWQTFDERQNATQWAQTVKEIATKLKS